MVILRRNIYYNIQNEYILIVIIYREINVFELIRQTLSVFQFCH